jgi:hypothetical protein
MDAKDLIKLWEKMKTDRAMWDSMWQEIADYIFPRKSNIYRTQAPGQKQTTKLYSSTAIKANEDLAAWLQSNLTSMAMDWFSLRIGQESEEILDKDGETWLENCKQTLFDNLRASNFSGQMHEAYLDLPSFCTTAMFIEELPEVNAQFGGLHFVTLQPGEYCIEEGADGKVKVLFRIFSLTAQAAFEKWSDKLSDKIIKAKDKEPATRFDFLHCVYPQDWYGGSTRTRLPYVSNYVDMEGKKLIQQAGFHEFPFAVIPWMKASGEKYGRGPGWTGLPNAKTENKAVENTFKQWAKAIDPPTMIRRGGLIGALVLTPGGRTYVTDHQAVKPYETGAKFDVDKVNREELKNDIREIFHGDKIRVLAPPEETGKMTAFEVSIRYAIAQQLLGPAFNYIVNEGLAVIIERSYNLQYRYSAGRNWQQGPFERPPESVLRAGQVGKDRINIEYESPLARAQRMHEVEAIIKFVGFMAPFSQTHPESWDNVDVDVGVRSAAKIMGLPKKMIRPMQGENSVKTIREARVKARVQQQAKEEAQLAAEVLSKGAGAVKDLPSEAVNQLAAVAGAGGVE